jgi:uncharacterized repeat protein (TIGR03803 family)
MLQFRAFLVLLAFATLTACAASNGRSTLPVAAPPSVESGRQDTKVKYVLLHSFGSGADGYSPSELVAIDGSLYGTTGGGGVYGKGTVFSLTATGTEHVLHSFGKGVDGAYPYGGLIELNGVLYGTTVLGGRNARGSVAGGTVFSITTTGREKVLVNLGKPRGPSEPYASLINVNGTLYGTTTSGGSDDAGTVFSSTPTGRLQILHSFDRFHGSLTWARLVAMKGVLYGTTQMGGSQLYGTAFSVTAKGTFKTLYNFGEGLQKAQFPLAGLTAFKGVLYGTTIYGGKENAGVIFALTTKGKATLLHSFTFQHDGQYSYGDLVVSGGLLYGTTRCGGSYSSDCRESGGPSLGGTVFSVTPGGKEAIVYSFGEKAGESITPFAGLIAVHDTLFGTTEGGGAYGNNYGTAYSLQLNP